MASARKNEANCGLAGFGPVCTPELRAAGISSIEVIRDLGWEEAWLRWVELFPGRVNVNAATGMLAAELGISWLKVTPEDKARVRAAVNRERAARQARNGFVFSR